MEKKRTYGVWAVRSSTSIFGPAQSWCKENGKPLEFDTKAAAENYAKEANEHTTANVRYYVKEKEPEPGAVRKGTSQPELDARSHEEVIPRNDAAEKQNEIPGRQIPSQTDPLVEIRSAVHSNYAGMVAMLGADNRVYLGCEERCHYQDIRNINKQIKEKRKIRVSLSNRDIEELAYAINQKDTLHKKLQVQIKQEEDQLKQSISNISHDLRTPLTSIQGYLTLLQECEDKQEQDQYIEIIKAKTDYLTDLVQEFYDLSVVENEQFDVECEKVDINRIVTDCLIEKYYEFGEIQPIIQTEKSPVWIYGNNLICKRIIENLITNAIRYSDNYIEVSINQEGVFMIKNSTQSLDEMDINLLFSKFYTVDKSRTKGGSGLGLYIVKELLKKIDGKIGNIEYNKPILSITLFFRLFK